ncbi:MAG: TIM44-like domain-containing protein, partial [Clostridia bacterium]|nr:TIM44-like domain-containing protein [Clostridia bacterium]
YIVIAIILIVITARSKKSGTSGSAKRVTVNIQETVATHSIDELKAIDPNFSDEALKEKISNLYVQMQNCWQAKDISPLRNSMTDAFYNQADRQIQALKSNNQTNMIENIAVLSVNLMGYNEDDTNTTIIAKLNTRIVDYVVDDKTGNVIKGSKTAEKFMTYEWLLIRSKGALTGENEGTTAVHCPSCGAPMNVNFSAKCEFCGTVIKQAEYDWVLSNIKGLSQTTV